MMRRATGRAPVPAGHRRFSAAAGRCRWLAVGVVAGRRRSAALFAPLLAPHSPYLTRSPRGGGPSRRALDGAGQRQPRHLRQAAVRRPLVAGHRPRRDRPGPGAGAIIGAVAATSRKAVDETIMRLLDVSWPSPASRWPRCWSPCSAAASRCWSCAIAFLYMPSVARVVRANVLAQYGEDYVAAERVIGARTPHILRPARRDQLRGAGPGLLHGDGGRRDRLRGVAVVHRRGRAPAGPVLGQRHRRRQEHGAARRLVGHGLPRPADPDHRARAEHPRPRASPTPGPPRPPGGRGTTQGRRRLRAAPSRAPARSPSCRAWPRPPARLAERARPLPRGRRRSCRVANLAIGFDDRHAAWTSSTASASTSGPGEVLGLVGESGCGKSLTALTVMGLQPRDARVSGEILFDGQDLLDAARARRAGGCSATTWR